MNSSCLAPDLTSLPRDISLVPRTFQGTTRLVRDKMNSTSKTVPLIYKCGTAQLTQMVAQHHHYQNYIIVIINTFFICSTHHQSPPP